MTWPDLADGVLSTVRDVLGVDVTYRPLAGGSFAARGTLGREYVAMPVGEGVEIDAARPKIFVRLADFAATPVRGDELDVSGGESYRVEVVKPDGEGGADLILEVA